MPDPNADAVSAVNSAQDTTTTDKTTTDTTTDVKKTATADPAKSIATTAITDTKDAQAAPQDWPEDWRTRMSGGDEKLLKRLERINSPKDVFQSWLEADKKINSAKLKPELPKNPTPEQVSAYRAALGVPEKPEGYDTKLEGYEIDDAHRPFVDDFLQRMHAKHASPELVKEALQTYYAINERQQVQMTALDNEAKKTTHAGLRQEWGAEYDDNIAVIKTMLTTAPEGIDELVGSARLPDGTSIINNPVFVRWIASQARTLYPLETIVPAGGGDKMEAIETEMRSIESKMGTKDYTEADRQRYAKLTGVKNSVKK